MPKKRHTSKHALKPFRPAHNTASSRPGATSNVASSPEPKSVNQILASLRRSSLGSAAHAAPSTLPSPAPTLPPALRQILQIPEATPPPPRSRPFVDAQGRRLPPGPPPPQSWQATRYRTAASQFRVPDDVSEAGRCVGDAVLEDLRLPGACYPAPGSLVDAVVRCMARNWQFQVSYDRFHLHALSGRLRSSLVRAVSLLSEDGLSARDLRLILLPPATPDKAPRPAVLNEDFFHLDLSSSVGWSIHLGELSDLLFPAQESPYSDPTESWDAPGPPPILPQLLPNLTHLSLAVSPLPATPFGVVPAHLPSWSHLLSLASRLPQLTHLSLAHWSEPTLTPNARFSSMVAPAEAGRAAMAVPLGGTGPYSHSLDDDFSEAVSIIRRLARSLYQLEYLDLTGCVAWTAPALTRADASGSVVDWAGHWGKVTVVRVGSGKGRQKQRPVASLPTGGASTEGTDGARAIERHVIALRKGTGRPVSVETDWTGDALVI